MGYRNRIAIIKKSKYNKISSMTADQFTKKYVGKDKLVSIDDIVDDVFDLGKDFDVRILNKYNSPFFNNKDCGEILENQELELFVINQEGFKAIIEYHHSLVKTYLKNLNKEIKINPNDANFIVNPELVLHIRNKLDEWDNNFGIVPYEIEGEVITKSDSHEYAIFELVRIYKSINWEKQVVAITGW